MRTILIILQLTPLNIVQLILKIFDFLFILLGYFLFVALFQLVHLHLELSFQIIFQIFHGLFVLYFQRIFCLFAISMQIWLFCRHLG